MLNWKRIIIDLRLSLVSQRLPGFCVPKISKKSLGDHKNFHLGAEKEQCPLNSKRRRMGRQKYRKQK
jgi:hypothetical protein